MFDLLLLPFFQRALLVGIILGVLMAVLGIIVVLRNMSFFADAIGHSALTGIAIGLLLGINPFLAALFFSLLVALAILGVRTISKQTFDTLLGVFFAAAVSLGVIIVSRTPGYQSDLVSFLFGNILTVSPLDIGLSLAMVAIVAAAFFFAGKAWLAITLNPDLAKAEGISVAKNELVFLLILAAVIALAIKFVGVILVTAMVIIPAAGAQNLAKSLKSMFTWSITISLVSVIVGMLVSALASLPSGPAIVLTGTILYALSLGARTLAK